MSVILQTERLTLRPPDEGDLDRIVAGIGTYAIAKFLTPVPHPYSRDDGRKWLDFVGSYRSDKTVFAIDLRDEGFVGCIGYEGELGYWLAERFWGRGLMTEAARAVVEWKFTDPKVSILECGSHLDNAASIRVQEKLGFVASGISRVYARARGVEVERVRTTLNRADFASACASLDAQEWRA